MPRTASSRSTIAELVKLKNPTLGTDFELNDHRGVVVGIATVASSGLFGTPTLYTTYKRAITYIPTTRYTTSYSLVEPKSPADIAHIKQVVKSLGYVAYTKAEFMARIAWLQGVAQRLQDTVALYAALGGGWESGQ
ncbi:hypothetical protein OKW39_000356 [Paraburkholderia sp. MM6662-R1]